MYIPPLLEKEFIRHGMLDNGLSDTRVKPDLKQ
jgi:hypothetical protein